jgi:hypothetical protein
MKSNSNVKISRYRIWNRIMLHNTRRFQERIFHNEHGTVAYWMIKYLILMANTIHGYFTLWNDHPCAPCWTINDPQLLMTQPRFPRCLLSADNITFTSCIYWLKYCTGKYCIYQKYASSICSIDGGNRCSGYFIRECQQCYSLLKLFQHLYSLHNLSDKNLVLHLLKRRFCLHRFDI